MPFSLLSILLTLALAGAVYLLYRDREQWRDRYFSLLDSSRIREAHLFDQILAAKQIRTVASMDKPLPVTKRTVSEEDVAEVADRLRERVEAGLMREADMVHQVSEYRNGNLTKSQLDFSLWSSQAASVEGSVAPD